MARKKKQEAGSPGAPLFMATYGDMVTLILCFFVLLYSFSTLDAKKFEMMAQSMQMAFNIQSGGKTAMPTQVMEAGSVSEGQGDVKKQTDSKETQTFQRVLALVDQAIKSEHLNDEIKVERNERGIVISFSEQIFFAPSSARIHPEALRILYKIGKILDKIPNKLAVEGHTDSDQPVGSLYEDNWGLSAARAAAVASYLNGALGIKSSRLRAVGLGSSSPLVPNDSPEHKTLNRRVDVVVLSLHSVR